MTKSYSALEPEDKIPPGTFEKPRPGLFDSTDFSKVTFDPHELLQLINDYRREKGLAPMRLDARLTAAAMEHAKDLATRDRISHYGSDGSNAVARSKRANYGNNIDNENDVQLDKGLIAENVAVGFMDSKGLLRGWQSSPGHNKNLLLEAPDVGLAMVKDTKTGFKTFWVMVAAAPNNEDYQSVPVTDKDSYFQDLSNEKQGAAPVNPTTRAASVGEPFLAKSEPKKFAAATAPTATF